MERHRLTRRLQLLRERFPILAPLLVLAFALGWAGSSLLAWTAGLLLLLLTLNQIAGHIRRD